MEVNDGQLFKDGLFYCTIYNSKCAWTESKSSKWCSYGGSDLELPTCISYFGIHRYWFGLSKSARLGQNRRLLIYQIPCYKHGLGVGTSYHGEGLWWLNIHSVQEVDGSVILVKEVGQYWWKRDFMASQLVEENIQRAHKSFHLGGLGAFQGNLSIIQ